MFDLQAHFEKRRFQIDAALERALPPADTRPAALHKAMRYAVFSGGKRLRPLLAMEAAASVGAPAEAGLPPGLAVELLHTYTLIHDDLPCMDDDDERRGKPTCHIAFGEANAVLAGDALQALAFEILSRANVSAPHTTAGLVCELAQAAGSQGVIGGQVEDLSAPQQPDAATVEFIHLHKTADLFRCAIRMGAMAGGATQDELQRLGTFATHLGLAFQITDDVLDEAPAHAAKEPELTCLSLYSRAEALDKAHALIRNGVRELEHLKRGPADALRAVAGFVISRTS
jgi:geranylgeranyl diphosphate synthase type II